MIAMEQWTMDNSKQLTYNIQHPMNNKKLKKQLRK